MEISQGDVADFVAQANEVGGLESQEATPAVASTELVDEFGAPDKEAIERAEKVKALEELEATQYDNNGNPIPKEEIKEEVVEEEVDLSAMSTQEKLAYFQKQLDAENGVEPNPLESVDIKLEEAGFDKTKLQDYELEYIENGELSPETIKALGDAGFDKTAIDAYVGTKVKIAQEKAVSAMNEVCGSEENFNKMADWMNTNLPEAELKAYNKNVQSEHAQVYLENMWNKYSKANPVKTEPRVLRGRDNTSSPTSNVNTFSSQFEMTRAMADPRYGKDFTYTREVRNKVSRMN